MKYSKEIVQFVDHLIGNYSEFSDEYKSYILDVEHIPDIELEEFASMFMEDESHAAEATGPDNPAYEQSMLPALRNYLKDTTNKDNEIEYLSAWKKGVSKYFKKSMEGYISYRLTIYNVGLSDNDFDEEYYRQTKRELHL